MTILTDSNNFIKTEFSNLNLGDQRLNKRVLKVAMTINKSPSLSIPAMSSESFKDLKALYRFFQNDKVDDQNLLETHSLNTIERMSAYTGKILLLNDSCFVTPVKDVGELLTRGKGIQNCVRTHYCLAISSDGSHIFGILKYYSFTNPINKKYPELQNESDIWLLTAKSSIKLILESSEGKKLLERCLFVADREADEYELIQFLIENNLGFIIRSQYNRRVDTNNATKTIDDITRDSINHGQVYKIKTQIDKSITEVEVQRKINKNVTIIPSEKDKNNYFSIGVNIVTVDDVKTQGNLVQWRLLTTENIDSEVQSEFVVKSYANRWKIEEVNKGAKTGVRVEERQFTKIDHFLPFLAMSFVIAWRLVALRTVSEVNPEAPIEESFTCDEVHFFKAYSRKHKIEIKNVKDGLLLIATLGGFTKSYSNPGWQILWKGWLLFSERVMGFILANESS